MGVKSAVEMLPQLILRLLSITGQVSFTSFFAHIVLFIVQVIEIRKLKKSI